MQRLASSSCTASLRSRRGGRVIAESGAQSCDIAAAPSRRAGLASVMHMSVHCTHTLSLSTSLWTVLLAGTGGPQQPAPQAPDSDLTFVAKMVALSFVGAICVAV